LSAKGEDDEFYDDAFAVIQRCGRPVRVHGFGIANKRTLFRFPFASADASNWLEGPRWGRIDYAGRLADIVPEPSDRGLAARTYLSAVKYARLEKSVRDVNPGFDLYFVVQPDNGWLLPALRVARHPKALTSFYGLKPRWAEKLRQFIEDPKAVLAEEPFASKYKLLQEARDQFG
jgi:hypothetical protein